MSSSDNGSKAQNRDISSTFIKGMAVLEAFDDTNTRLALSDIAALTGLDRASVRRLVLTLVELGYVRKSGRHFLLTPRVLVLAGGFLRGNRFGTFVQPVLNRYAALLGSAISLAMADGDEAVFVAQSTLQNSAVSFGFTIGSRLPLLHTSIGRMLLAYGDPHQTGAFVNDAELTAYTNDTLMDRGIIGERIEEVARQGFAIVDGEFEARVTAFAVPIGHKGNLNAVLGASEPFHAVANVDERYRYIDVLQQCAIELERSKVLGAD
jgi:IclR family pca regulon transcriptional regulator